MSWLKKMVRSVSGAEKRERIEAGEAILREHELRDHFDPQGAMDRLSEIMQEEEAIRLFIEHCRPKISQVVRAALEDGLLDEEEERRITAVRQRYGNIQIDAKTEAMLESARKQYLAWKLPLEPVQSPLMLKSGEWCAHAVQAEALEERQRTVRVNYSGPSARVRVMKGIYYNVGSIQTDRQSEGYMHSFGFGVLGATNKRFMWISPSKSISVPLQKIVLFEPYSDGIKLIKDTGKPVLFCFPEEDRASVARLSRVIEELR